MAKKMQFMMPKANEALSSAHVLSVLTASPGPLAPKPPKLTAQPTSEDTFVQSALEMKRSV